MRYHHALIVLAACLFAATAAAQGTFESSKSVGYEPTVFGVARFAPTFASGTSESGTSESATTSSRNLQEQDPYDRRAIFLREHGDFMNRRERYKPMISVGANLLANQSIRHEPGHFREFGAFTDINLPWNVSTDGYLMFGLYGSARRYQFKNMGQGAPLGDETLYAAGVKLGFGAFLDDNLLLEVETHPGVFTDADGPLKHQDFDYPSFAVATMRVTPDLFLKAGVRYNQVFHDAPWLPILGISWDITGNSAAAGGEADLGGWRLDVLLPEHAEVSYWPSGSTGWLLGVEITGAEYHVRTSASTSPPRQQDNLQVQEVTAYLGLVERLSDNFSFTARVGAPLAGQYDLTTGENGFNRVEGALSSGPFAEISFGFDF
jgi:hypothetical protein